MAEHIHDQAATLSADRCRELLSEVTVGRLAWVSGDGSITVVPVNFTIDGQTVVFRTSESVAHELRTSPNKPAFEVDYFEEAMQAGWSVLIQGDIERLYGAEDVERVGALVKPWTGQDLPASMCLSMQRVSGREILIHPGGVSVVHTAQPDT